MADDTMIDSSQYMPKGPISAEPQMNGKHLLGNKIKQAREKRKQEKSQDNNKTGSKL